MNNTVSERKCGIGYTGANKVKSTTIPYNLMFADYCGPFDSKRIREVASYLRRMSSGLLYVTFSFPDRKKDGTVGVCQGLRLSYNNLGRSLGKRIIKMSKSDARQVYSVLYRGGGMESTNMMTIGFSIGDCSDVKMIEKDTRDDPVRIQARQTHSRFKANPKMLDGPKPQIKKSKAQKKAEALQKRRDIFCKFVEQGLSNTEIAIEMDISRGVVGSLAAHYRNAELKKWGNKRA
jgi:hypothetical protein